MSVEQLPLGLGSLSVPYGTHIALIYDDEQERASALFAFMKAGLENGEKCIAAVMEYTRDYWLQGLYELGLDARPVLDKQLVILTPTELCWDGRSYPEAEPGLLVRMVEETPGEDWRALRVCTGMIPFLQKSETLPPMLGIELDSCHSLQGSKAIMMCSFGKSRLHERVLDLCLRTHPVILSDAQLQHNARYEPPGALRFRLPGILRELDEAGALEPPFAGLYFASGVPVLKVCGEIDMFTAPRLDDLGRSMAQVGHKLIIVDLSNAPFLDAAAIGVLIKLSKVVKARGGRLVIYDPECPLRKIFELIHIDMLIPVRHEFEEALHEALR